MFVTNTKFYLGALNVTNIAVIFVLRNGMNGGKEQTCIRIIFPCLTCKSQFGESSNNILTCREGRIANSSVRSERLLAVILQ